MAGENFRDVQAFLIVAKERSFTRAAARLGVSQSALSHTIRALEARLGLRLLTRTTRSVSATEAGERLIQTVGPRFEVIAEELAAFEALRDQPAGSVRITASDFAMNTVLWPKLSKLQRDHPEISIEIATDPGLVDIVAERYDAGVRFGDQVAQDMSSVPISPEVRMVIVGSPSYLADNPAPQSPADLTAHSCINTRFSMHGDRYAWELRKGDHNLQVRVEGRWTFNSLYPAVEAALEGFGLAFVPENLVQAHIQSGRLVSVMGHWCPTFPALHIFYENRHPTSPALARVIEALRYRS